MLENGNLDSHARPVRRSRRRLRFGLRTFLIGVAAVSIALGMMSREFVRLRHQRAIVAQILAVGGGVTYDFQVAEGALKSTALPVPKRLRRAFGNDLFAEVASVKWEYTYQSVPAPVIVLLSQLPAVQSVSFYGSPRANGRPPAPGESQTKDVDAQAEIAAQADAFATIADCKYVTHLTLFGGLPTDLHLTKLRDGGNLRRLELSYSSLVTDAGIEAISGFQNLVALEICHVPNVSDRGVATLSRLKNLQSLDLSGTPVSDLALPELGKLIHLERLLFDGSSITDTGLGALSNLTKLKLLRISHSNITDEGLKTIGAMSELRELDLSGTQITSLGLDHLLTLNSLIKLSLAETQVTDEGLLHVAKLASLRHVVVLLDHGLTLDGVRQAKRQLPGCLFECLYAPVEGQPPLLYAWE